MQTPSKPGLRHRVIIAVPLIPRDEPPIDPLRGVSDASILVPLAHAWWSDRLTADWQPRTRAQNQAILDQLELTGDFWRLP
jgi:hypothetical protein